MKDVFPSIALLDKIKTMLAIIVVPAEGIITLLYWGMTFIDPTLLVPPGTDFKIPLALDLGLHFFPALFLWYASLFSLP